MKKIWIALLCIFFAVSLFAFAANAEELTVFVKDGGRGNGETTDRALGTLSDAFAILGKEGGTIVLCGKTTMDKALTTLSPWEGLITLTMVHDGTDYRESGAELYYTGQHRFFFAGPAKVENFTFHIAETAVIAAQWHPLEMGEGITVKQHASGAGIYLLGGTQDAAEGSFAYRDRAPQLVVRSGKYHAVTPYGRQIRDTFTASAETFVYGGEINYLMGGPLNFGILTGDSTLHVYGGRIQNLCLFTDPGNTTTDLMGKGRYTANVYGGEIGKVICDANNAEASFFLNCAENAQTGLALLAEGESAGKLKTTDTTVPKTSAAPTEAPVGADKTLFVKDGGMGDGSSPDRALGVLSDAFALLGKEGGTIVICGKATMHTALTALTPWEGLITLTMAHDGTDYRESGAELYYTGQHRFFFAGPAKVENFTFHIAETAVIAAQWHPLEMGEGIIVKQHASGAGIYLLGGTQNAAEGSFAYRDRAPQLVIRSGKYHAVTPYGRQIQGTFTASATTEIYGGEINYMNGGPLNFGILTGDSTLHVYGGRIQNLCLFTDPGNTTDRLQGEGSYIANVYGGEIGKIICDANNSTAKFYLNYGEGAQADLLSITEGEGLANLITFNLAEPTVTEVKLTIGASVGYVNGEAKPLDAAPVIRNDRTMLPVRFVAENLGATVGWDGATSTVTVTSGTAALEIVIGKATAKVNGAEITLDSPAFIENSRTYLPVRFVAENLGATVGWDGATSTATLTAERTVIGAPKPGTVTPPAVGG